MELNRCIHAGILQLMLTTRIAFGDNVIDSGIILCVIQQFTFVCSLTVFAQWLANVHRVSKELCKIVFVRTSSNFHQSWYFLAE